ncbi:heme ABC transporter ATP-binding protein [Paenibacillus selenitireducens]|uniref:Heme ABC transporter ATP-binding protein n=1 Tax=Paenibacillus selenitireducens TaxID=1324314 RepID=A0A1T2X845_9BACL|nr:ABC transporter ATP-binding protein [Paenibacillus selenitireducens]OPA76069.1 heme ABC transporter ATP-binding protein [Paenibacillus selenitireducens]
MISFHNFSFQYQKLTEPTLRNINLDIRPGEKILIAGPSGSGKSTLAHCINGLIPFTYEGKLEGTMTLHGESTTGKSIFEISQSVGTILQDLDGQFIGLSVGEDVAFSFENDGVPRAQMKQEVERALTTVNMLDYIDQSPHDLSGGQKQRVSLAGILSTQADILLFDEPLANLDPASGKQAMKMIDDIHQQTNKTIIIIEHRIEDVLEQLIDRIVVMSEGEIQAIGTPDEILSSDILRKHGLREPLYIEALKYAGCELSAADELTQLHHINVPKFENALTSWYNAGTASTSSPSKQPLLDVQNVRFSYDGEHEVIRGVSFQVQTGEIVALLGNNGAGKSTLSHLIMGIVRQSSGEIRLQGEEIRNWSIRKRGEQIGYVMQNPNQMITQHMIWDEVALGLTIRGVSKETIDAKVEHILRICGLYPYRNWPISALSYGQKKRVTIAAVLAMEPKLIILDEPTAGQDYKHYTEFMEFIAELARTGLSFIFITHDMHLALEYTDSAVVISGGEVIANDKVASVLTNAEVIERANLKETSLSVLARVIGLPSAEGFVQHFINYEKQVKHHE